MRLHPPGNIFSAGEAEPVSCKRKQLPPAAIFITVGFIAFDDSNKQRDKKAEKSQPCKKDIEKSQDQISKRNDPEIIIPFLFIFHCSVPSSLITLAGHSLTHCPHPTHNSKLILAWMPSGMEMALRGQTLIQHPQATHSLILTTAFLFLMELYLH